MYQFFNTKQTFYITPYLGPIMGGTRVIIS
jgi:hypothetical protein